MPKVHDAKVARPELNTRYMACIPVDVAPSAWSQLNDNEISGSHRSGNSQAQSRPVSLMCSNREAESLTNPQDDLFGLLELISRGEVQAGRALRRGVEQHIRSDLVGCHGTKILEDLLLHQWLSHQQQKRAKIDEISLFLAFN